MQLDEDYSTIIEKFFLFSKTVEFLQIAHE